MSFRIAHLPRFGTLFSPLACLTLVIATLSAQQSKVLAPHKPIPPRVPQSIERQDPGVPRSMVGGFWMIDANRKASIYLRNGLETSSLTVTPSIYLSNGVRYKLTPITLEASGTAVVSINDSLQANGIAPWAILSGYVEVAYNWAWDPLCISVTSTDPIHSTIFTYGLQPSVITDLRFHVTKSKFDGMFATEGMWWKPEPGVTGFLGLSNITADSIDARIQVTDNQNNPLGTYTARISPHATKIVSLGALGQAASGTAGGLRILHTGSEEGLLINGGLEDQSSGYSANLPFHYRFGAAPEPNAPETYAELGLMTGAADPMMAFPAGTTFTPFSMARNVSNTAVSVTPSLYWMQGAAAHSARLHTFTLLPFESRQLDMPALLAEAGLRAFNGSFNLILESQAQPRSLLLASGSVDQKNTYVFQVLPHGVQESAAKTISYWSTAKGDDTMVTVWNPADESQDYRLTLFFAGGRYVLPIHLEARATRSLNISSVIENQIPDESGNTIPGTVHEGSAKISGSHADNEEILVAIDAGTYNVRKATCSYYCISCDGEILTYLVLNPFSVAKSASTQVYFQIKTNTGSLYYSNGTWSSSNTGVITVNSSSGLATGAGSGKSTMSAYIDSINVYNSYYCAYDPFCPYNAYASGSGSGSGFSVTSVSPPSLTFGGSGILTITGSGFQSLTSPTVQFASGSGITTGAPSVISDTQMTASYQVTCSALVGAQTLQIGSFVDGGVSGTNWTESVVLPSAPTPTIKLGGNTISGTQAVVVGQQIALTGSASLPACMSVTSQQWAPSSSGTSGTPIGGYSTSTSSGSVTALPVNTNSSYTFYWAYPASSVQATYQYTMAGGGGSTSSPVATATFNITGPTGGTMTSTPITKLYIANLSACTGHPGGPFLIFAAGATGSLCSLVVTTPGITFNTPTGYSNSSGGSFLAGQLVSHDTLTGGGTTYGPGLDSIWPYAGGTLPTNDNPSILLASTYRTLTRSFEATMFVMWQSSKANSIPAPLGYQTWQFSATASCSANCGTTSNWSVTSSSPGLEGGFTASTSSQSSVKQNTLKYGYPTWTSVSY